jgi:hypothetical protein
LLPPDSSFRISSDKNFTTRGGHTNIEGKVISTCLHVIHSDYKEGRKLKSNNIARGLLFDTGTTLPEEDHHRQRYHREGIEEAATFLHSQMDCVNSYGYKVVKINGIRYEIPKFQAPLNCAEMYRNYCAAFGTPIYYEEPEKSLLIKAFKTRCGQTSFYQLFNLVFAETTKNSTCVNYYTSELVNYVMLSLLRLVDFHFITNVPKRRELRKLIKQMGQAVKYAIKFGTNSSDPLTNIGHGIGFDIEGSVPVTSTATQNPVAIFVIKVIWKIESEINRLRGPWAPIVEPAPIPVTVTNERIHNTRPRNRGAPVQPVAAAPYMGLDIPLLVEALPDAPPTIKENYDSVKECLALSLKKIKAYLAYLNRKKSNEDGTEKLLQENLAKLQSGEALVRLIIDYKMKVTAQASSENSKEFFGKPVMSLAATKERLYYKPTAGGPDGDADNGDDDVPLPVLSPSMKDLMLFVIARQDTNQNSFHAASMFEYMLKIGLSNHHKLWPQDVRIVQCDIISDNASALASAETLVASIFIAADNGGVTLTILKSIAQGGKTADVDGALGLFTQKIASMVSGGRDVKTENQLLETARLAYINSPNTKFEILKINRERETEIHNALEEPIKAITKFLRNNKAHEIKIVFDKKPEDGITSGQTIETMRSKLPGVTLTARKVVNAGPSRSLHFEAGLRSPSIVSADEGGGDVSSDEEGDLDGAPRVPDDDAVRTWEGDDELRAAREEEKEEEEKEEEAEGARPVQCPTTSGIPDSVGSTDGRALYATKFKKLPEEIKKREVITELPDVDNCKDTTGAVHGFLYFMHELVAKASGVNMDGELCAQFLDQIRDMEMPTKKMYLDFLKCQRNFADQPKKGDTFPSLPINPVVLDFINGEHQKGVVNMKEKVSAASVHEAICQMFPSNFVLPGEPDIKNIYNSKAMKNSADKKREASGVPTRGKNPYLTESFIAVGFKKIKESNDDYMTRPTTAVWNQLLSLVSATPSIADRVEDMRIKVNKDCILRRWGGFKKSEVVEDEGNDSD